MIRRIGSTSALYALTFVACVHPPDSGEDDTGQGELVAVDGCSIEPAFFSDVSAEQTEQPTVFAMSWTTSEEAGGYVVAANGGGTSGELLKSGSTSAGPSTSHDILLRGLPSNTDVHYRLVASVGDGLICSDERVASTGILPGELPTFELSSGPSDARLGGYTLAPVITADSTFASIFDAQGRLVWAWEREDTIWRVQMARDGDGVLINKHASSVSTKGTVSKLSFDGVETDLAAVRAAHTDFVELPDGTLAVLGWEIKEFEYEGVTRRILGDNLLEVDSSGQPRVVWSVFDHFDPDLDEVYPPSPQVAADIEDWSHVNGFSYDDATEQYVLSVSGLNTVVGVRQSSGEQLWSMGDHGETFDVPLETVHWPHSAYAYGEDAVVVFNRNDYENGECSEVIILEMDASSGTAEQVMTYAGDECLSVYYLGEARPLDDGSIQVIWTTAGRIDHVDPDGTQRWSLQGGLGAGIGFSTFTTSLYPPEDG